MLASRKSREVWNEHAITSVLIYGMVMRVSLSLSEKRHHLPGMMGMQ